MVVGGGKRFFPDGVRLDLTLVEQRRFGNGVVVLRYSTDFRTRSDSSNPLRVRFQKHRRAGEPNPLLDCSSASGATFLAGRVRRLATQSRAARLSHRRHGDGVGHCRRPMGACTRGKNVRIAGKMTAAPGKRDAFIAILLEGTAAMAGCLSYIIAKDGTDADAVWITEVWDTKESRDASLSLPSVKDAITRGRPLIAGVGERIVATPVGGHGLPKDR